MVIGIASATAVSGRVMATTATDTATTTNDRVRFPARQSMSAHHATSHATDVVSSERYVARR
jgi:hypothetical protein